MAKFPSLAVVFLRSVNEGSSGSSDCGKEVASWIALRGVKLAFYPGLASTTASVHTRSESFLLDKGKSLELEFELPCNGPADSDHYMPSNPVGK